MHIIQKLNIDKGFDAYVKEIVTEAGKQHDPRYEKFTGDLTRSSFYRGVDVALATVNPEFQYAVELIGRYLELEDSKCRIEEKDYCYTHVFDGVKEKGCPVGLAQDFYRKHGPKEGTVLPKGDTIGSPRWFVYLTTRTANTLHGGLYKGRNMLYKYDYHKHIEIDFDSHTDETLRPLIKDLIEKKLLNLKRIRRFGKKSINEIEIWCGLKKEKKDEV